MSEKVDFKKEVGQAVIGNVVEAPRLSNVVTLHVGDQQKEVELITHYQRSSIKKQVIELAALTGDAEIEIYKVFIRDYGLRRFKELPRQHYQDVKSKLEQWIHDAQPRDIEAPVNGQVPLKQSALDIFGHQHHLHVRQPCLACAEKSASFARLQRTSRIQVIALTACALLCGWLLYKAQAPLTDGEQAAADQKCFIAGNAYSLGYIAREKGRAAMECAQPAVGVPAVWREVGRTR